MNAGSAGLEDRPTPFGVLHAREDRQEDECRDQRQSARGYPGHDLGMNRQAQPGQSCEQRNQCCEPAPKEEKHENAIHKMKRNIECVKSLRSWSPHPQVGEQTHPKYGPIKPAGLSFEVFGKV